MRNKLLIATAVTALLAGTGLASAQENHRGAPNGGRPAAPQASHAQPGPRAQATPHMQPMQQPRIQSQRENTNRAPTRMGQNEPRSDRLNAQERRNQQPTGRTEQRPNTVQGQERQNTVQGRPEERQNTAQSRENNHNVQLSTEQRTKIRQTVIAEHGAPRVSRADLGGIDLRVGAAIPRDRIHFRPLPLPESVVEIEPEWQGYLYFLVGDELVVIDPATYDVVAILPA
jgi:hypothetical protein